VLSFYSATVASRRRAVNQGSGLITADVLADSGPAGGGWGTVAAISGRTKLVFLAGDPIDHAKGFSEYADALDQAGLDAAYLPVHVPAGQLGAFLAGLRWARNLAGVVATIPHKQEARAIGRPDDAARRSGSANLLRPAADGGWECSMVDGAGFLSAVDAAGISLAGRCVQVLGAGGAGRAVAMAIAERGPAGLAVHDPDAARAELLVADLVREFPSVPVEAALGPSEVLVNCSPLGMGHDERVPVPEALIPASGAVYDIVNRADTPLLVAAARLGCRTDWGRSMLLAQIPLVLRYFFAG
jgi:shikimate dehydrogenase